MKTIAILCGGGPAPGINTVVATVTKVFLKEKYRVLAIHEGFKGLFSDNPEVEELTYDKAEQIFPRGGSYIKMSRFKPKDEDFKANLFEKYGIELLVTIGGDDTASTANRLTKYLSRQSLSVKNIHVPKTIDNDLPLQEGIPTFGFMSAKQMGMDIGKIIKTESASTQNWYFVMTMGREAGHLAYEIGKGIQADMIIIPEMFTKGNITIDKIIRLAISSMIKKKIEGKNAGVVVVGEGVFHFLKNEDIEASGISFEYDAHGHPELGSVSKSHIINQILCKKIKELNLTAACRPVEMGYSLRCVDPSNFDLTYCATLGIGVKKLYEQGFSGCMVSVDVHQNVLPIFLKDVEDENGKIKTRLVNIDREEVQNVFTEMLFYLSESDREKASQFIDNPEKYEFNTILNEED